MPAEKSIDTDVLSAGFARLLLTARVRRWPIEGDNDYERKINDADGNVQLH